MCACGKRELSFAWLVSFCSFPHRRSCIGEVSFCRYGAGNKGPIVLNTRLQESQRGPERCGPCRSRGWKAQDSPSCVSAQISWIGSLTTPHIGTRPNTKHTSTGWRCDIVSPWTRCHTGGSQQNTGTLVLERENCWWLPTHAKTLA